MSTQPRHDDAEGLALTSGVFEQLPTAAQIEVDLFCAGCGYNLHGQQVRQQPDTKLLVVQCPECGQWDSATHASSVGKLWLFRLGRVALLLWLVLAHGIAVCLVLAHVAVVGLAGETLYAYYRSNSNEVLYDPRWWLIVVAAGAASILLGLFTAMAATVLFPHWKWWSVLIASLVWPTVSVTVVYVSYNGSAPSYLPWVMWYAVPLGFAHLIGGLVGVPFGRALARLMVRIILPPRVRPLLNYLWTTDGLPVPSIKA